MYQICSARAAHPCVGFSSSKHLCPEHECRARKAHRLNRCRASESDSDFVTNVFARVFGKESLTDPEPMGLKRITPEDARQMYPATTTEWATLLPSDVGELATLRPMLAHTLIEDKPLRLAYDAERDGWNAAAFHAGVDTFGGALVVAETEGGAVVGGFNPRGWVGMGWDRDAINAFLFTWRDGDCSGNPVKLPKVGGASMAVLDKEEIGPQFGPDGLKVSLSPGDERRAYSKLGSYYSRLPNGGKSLFSPDETGRKGTLLTSLRVYVAEGGPETFELDGIVWKSSQATESA